MGKAKTKQLQRDPWVKDEARTRAESLLRERCPTPTEHGWWASPGSRGECQSCLTEALLEFRNEGLKKAAIISDKIPCETVEKRRLADSISQAIRELLEE